MSPSPESEPLLFTPTSNVLAHVGPCVILAREWQRRGHRIVFAGLPRYLADPGVVSPGEFEFYEFPDFEFDKGLEILRTVRKRPLDRAIKANIAAELRLWVDQRAVGQTMQRPSRLPSLSCSSVIYSSQACFSSTAHSASALPERRSLGVQDVMAVTVFSLDADASWCY